MNKVNLNKNILIISIVIIAILGATIACIFSAKSDEQTASAELVYTNGKVPD